MLLSLEPFFVPLAAGFFLPVPASELPLLLGRGAVALFAFRIFAGGC